MRVSVLTDHNLTGDTSEHHKETGTEGCQEPVGRPPHGPTRPPVPLNSSPYLMGPLSEKICIVNRVE